MTKQRKCGYCGEIFDVPKNTPWEIYCCSDHYFRSRKYVEENEKKKRIEAFHNDLKDMEVLDVLAGKLVHKGVSDRMTVKKSRDYEGSRFVVVVVKKKKEDV